MASDESNSDKVTKEKNELRIQKSIRQLPKIDIKDDENGENLSSCSDTEWDASDEPFSAQLLNVKSNPNKVSVFTGPSKTGEEFEFVTAKSPAISPLPKDERPVQLAKMMEKIFGKLIDSRPLDTIKVTITTKSATAGK